MKPTSKNQVIDYLQWTTDEYEQRLFKAIWNWCIVHGQTSSVTQQLMASSKINKWFMNEYSKLEFQFILIAENVPCSTKQLEDHYKACTAQITDIWPKVLLEDIKRNNDFNSKLITNTPTIYAN